MYCCLRCRRVRIVARLLWRGKISCLYLRGASTALKSSRICTHLPELPLGYPVLNLALILSPPAPNQVSTPSVRPFRTSLQDSLIPTLPALALSCTSTRSSCSKTVLVVRIMLSRGESVARQLADVKQEAEGEEQGGAPWNAQRALNVRVRPVVASLARNEVERENEQSARSEQG